MNNSINHLSYINITLLSKTIQPSNNTNNLMEFVVQLLELFKTDKKVNKNIAYRRRDATFRREKRYEASPYHTELKLV